MSVCLSVCVSQKHVQMSPGALCMIPVAVARPCYDDNAIGLRYVLSVLWMTPGFHNNGANGPESKTPHMFRLVSQVAAPVAKSAVSDCILLNDGKLIDSSS